MTVARTCRLIWRGLGTLPGYGSHPGVPIVALLIVLAALSGAKGGGWVGAVVGAVIMAATFLPLLAWGAYCRGRDQERRQ
jgi:hypothetical protein